MFVIDFEKVSEVLLRNGDWVRVVAGTFSLTRDDEWFQFQEETRKTATTTVYGLTTDIISVKTKTDPDPNGRPRRTAVVM